MDARYTVSNAADRERRSRQLENKLERSDKIIENRSERSDEIIEDIMAKLHFKVGI